MNNVPIVFAFDDNYLLPGMVTILSMLNSAKKDTFYDIKILCGNELSINNREEVYNFIEKVFSEKATIEFIDMKDEFSDAPTVFHLSKAAYYRLLMHKYFPNHDKIIWCDVDTIIRGDFADLYKMDIGNHYLGSCLCISGITNPEGSFFKGNSFSHKYFSSGIMLVNLKKFREENIETRFFDVIEKHGKDLLFLDQDILNEVCGKNYEELPWRYNTYSDIYKNKFGDSYYKKLRKVYSDDYIKEELKNVVVSHYEGTEGKPWCKKGFVREWYEIAFQTPFKSIAKDMYEKNKTPFPISRTMKQLKILFRKVARGIK